MNRRQLLLRLSGLAAISALPVYLLAAADKDKDKKQAPALLKSKRDWQQRLPEASYLVLFEEDTERPFSSPLNHEKREGTYVCAACNLPLFISGHKFDSGTGWPSFWKPNEGAVATKEDRQLFSVRTEYHCMRCSGHQGHVFDDGPAPTGLRYCNNGLALRFVPISEPLPTLVS